MTIPRPKHRREFPALMEAMGVRQAVEVGTAAGDFARVLLQCRSLERLWLVDHYPNPDDSWMRDAMLELTREDPRAVWVPLPSIEAAAKCGPLDMAYIDPSHFFKDACDDLEAWADLVRILSGHDYCLWNPAAAAPCGVIPAVEAFAEARGLRVHLTGEHPDHTPAQRLLAAQAAEDEFRDNYGWQGDNIPSFWMLTY